MWVASTRRIRAAKVCVRSEEASNPKVASVPFVSTGSRIFKKTLPDRDPALRDVAPTVLNEMGLTIPPEMDGVSLLES